MSASNYNWVCFICRFSTRHAKKARSIPKCSQCGRDCYCLGYKVEIPSRSNIRNWRALRSECRKRELARIDKMAVKSVRETHAAERLERDKIAKTSLWNRMRDLVVKDNSSPRDLSSNKRHLRGYGKSRSKR